MKTFNFKLFNLLILTILIAGCLPDSLTKFKKDSSPQPTGAPVPTITDTSGKVIPTSSIVYPSTFYFQKDSVQVSSWPVIVGTEYVANALNSLNPVIDGSLGDSTIRSSMFNRCELDTSGLAITQTLPPGIYLDPTKCSFFGTPISIFSDTPPNQGKPIQYTIKYYFKNARGLSGNQGAVSCSASECYISTSIGIGSYVPPANMNYSQGDKIAIALKNLTTAGMGIFKPDDSNVNTNSDVVISNKGTIGSIQFLDSTSATLYVLRAIPLIVSNVSPFVIGSVIGTFDKINLSNTTSISIGDTISVGTYIGTINDIGSTYVNVFRSANSSTSTPSGTATITHTDNSTSPATITTYSKSISAGSSLTSSKLGRVMSIDSTNKIIKVMQFAEYLNSFAVTDIISPINSSSTTTITSVNLNDSFKVSESIDNDVQFYSSKGDIDESADKIPVQYYSVGSNINPIFPITDGNNSLISSNGITYSISPTSLPTGLSLDTTTGIITGAFTSTLAPTSFTLIASNPTGSVSKNIKIAAIYSPKDLSYNNRQLITVSNLSVYPNSLFYEGEDAYLPITPPAVSSVSGKILRKINTNMLSIETNNGPFLLGKIIDSGRLFYSQKALIPQASAIYDFNLILKLSTITGFTIGNYVASSSGAVGRIIYIDSAQNTLYIQFLTPDTSAVKNFIQGQGVDAGLTYISTKATIIQLEAKNYALIVSDDSSFTNVGQDLTACSSGACGVGTNKVSGYIYDHDSTNKILFTTDVSRTTSNFSNPLSPIHQPEFLNGYALDVGEKYNTNTTTITSVSHDNLFVITRGQDFELRPSFSQGSNLIFSVVPDLPTGLTLDSKTGIISGNASLMSARKNYIITAKNLLGSTSFKMDLEVRDYISLEVASDNTSSNLHKYGDTQNIRKCRVNASDILNAQGQLDISCFLEMQEEDLYFGDSNTHELKLKAMVGPGVCEYISYSPYSFSQFRPNGFSIGSVNYVNGCTSAAGLPGTFTTENPTNMDLQYCPGNWSAVDQLYPNCDASSFSVVTYSTTLDNGTCSISSVSSSTIKCGGAIRNCIQGPVTDILSRAQINSGMNGFIYPTSSGINQTWSHKAPTSFSDLTNKRLANYSFRNNSGSSVSEMDAWETHQSGVSYFTSPHSSMTSPYYTVNCLDAARDFKAKIRVRIRDWDSAFKVTDNLDFDTLTRPAKMDVNAMNSFLDWDNDSVIYTGLNPSTPSSCTNATYTNPTSCISNGAIWSDGSNYQFPGGGL
jgi:hypothetical protein